MENQLPLVNFSCSVLIHRSRIAYIFLFELKPWKVCFLSYIDMFVLETGSQDISNTNGIILRYIVPTIQT